MSKTGTNPHSQSMRKRTTADKRCQQNFGGYSTGGHLVINVAGHKKLNPSVCSGERGVEWSASLSLTT